MIVVATDAPLDARNLERLAARAIFALARTGSTYSNGSGDFAIAFSTHPSLRLTTTDGPQPRTVLPTDASRACSKRCSTPPKKRSTTRCSGPPTRRETAARSARSRSRRSPRSSRSTDDEARVAAAIGAVLLGLCIEPQRRLKRDGSGRASTPSRSTRRSATRTGGSCPNLVKEDFTVLDNGAPREITLFSSEIQPITVAIMLDMSGSMFSRFIRLRTSTLSFVDALLPQDRAQIGASGKRSPSART